MKLGELEALHRAATSGKWRAYGQWVAVVTAHAAGDPEAPDTRILECGEFDADCIAATHNALPLLLEALRAAQELRKSAFGHTGIGTVAAFDAAMARLEESDG